MELKLEVGSQFVSRQTSAWHTVDRAGEERVTMLCKVVAADARGITWEPVRELEVVNGMPGREQHRTMGGYIARFDVARRVRLGQLGAAQ